MSLMENDRTLQPTSTFPLLLDTRSKRISMAAIHLDCAGGANSTTNVVQSLTFTKKAIKCEAGAEIIVNCESLSQNTDKIENVNLNKLSRIFSSSSLTAIVVGTVVALTVRPVMAQAPINDVVGWPSGLLLLATVLYAALGNPPDILWATEPVIGLFLGSGLPHVSIPIMQRVKWSAKTCHFVPRIRPAHGISNFWIRSEEVSQPARDEALGKALGLLSPVVYEPFEFRIDETLCATTPAGLLASFNLESAFPPVASVSCPSPSAHDFLLFSAIHYHVFWEWEVQVEWKGKLAFSTKGTDARAVFDVHSEEMALPVVASRMVARPHEQSIFRGVANNTGGHIYGPYTICLDSLDRNMPMCSVDFHSYAKTKYKVSASLNELAGAYYRVVQYINRSAKAINLSDTAPIAHIHVGQTLWLAILGGVILDSGRLTIQHLPGRWTMGGVSADEAYLLRIEAILTAIEPYANKPPFEDLVFSGGINRAPAIPFLLIGLFGQIIICYFLSLGTSAGVWTSVALANTLFAGRLTDLHSLYLGKTLISEEPGMKMYVPGRKELMVVATFDRTAPREGGLRAGFLLNSLGLLGAIFGAVFQDQTREALGFPPFTPCPKWVVYTCALLLASVSLLITIILVLQQLNEKTWFNDSQLPMRWMIYSTVPCSVLMVGLAVFFEVTKLARLWPVLDALTWLSGVPLGMMENGRFTSGDDNMIHLILINRWLMGAVASAVGSS